MCVLSTSSTIKKKNEIKKSSLQHTIFCQTSRTHDELHLCVNQPSMHFLFDFIFLNFCIEIFCAYDFKKKFLFLSVLLLITVMWV